MYRLEHNTPTVYTNKSRDFQLFTRLYDVINNGVKYDIDTIPNILDAFKINDRLLALLGTKLGFFPKYTYDNQILRYILSAFQHIMKYKGSKKGIEEAVCCVLRAEHNDGDFSVLINNATHTVEITTSNELFNKRALGDLLSYILPIGYTYQIETSTSNLSNDKFTATSEISVLLVESESISQVRGSDRVLATQYPNENNEFNFTGTINTLDDLYIANYNTSTIIGSEQITAEIEGTAPDRLGTIRDKVDIVTDSNKQQIKESE